MPRHDCRLGAHINGKCDMVAHMKTTVDIADSLLQEAKRTATRERTTLRELVEEGLRLSLEKRRKSQVFRLRRVGYGGQGLQAGIREGRWEDLRELSYEGRGT